MVFDLNKSIEILERTPGIVTALLQDLSSEWLFNNEGADTWSPYDIIGHYIEGEKTDWIPRMRIILSNDEDKRFVPFNRFAQLNNDKNTPINTLLHEFTEWRKNNILELKEANLNEEKLNKKGIHPEFGEVTLRQLLATWVAHDLNHIHQISRVMAKQYKEEIGPWTRYISVVNK
jgi:DinB superfamily